MIVKDSQLQKQVPDRTEWPLTLTPEQREQLLQEKLARASRAYQNDMNTRILQVVDDPDHPGELLLDLGTELCEELGWKAGDTVQWIDNKDGTWQITLTGQKI